MKLVSFYCDIDGSNYYSEHAKKLKIECESLDMDYIIVEQNFGSTWIDNVRAKPIFLKKMLNELNDDFIWLDVDARVLKKIDLVINNCDWMSDFRGDKTPHDYVHVIKNSEKNKIFIEKWIQHVSDYKKGSHSSFVKLFNELKIKQIPKRYVSIGELSNNKSKTNYLKNG